MSPTGFTGALLGAAFAGSLLLLIAALAGWRPRLRSRRVSSTSVWWNAAARRRALIGVAVAVVVTVLTKWPVAGIAIGAVIFLWPRMFGAGKAAAKQMERLEGLTVWTEGLRDTIAGAVGLEQAIQHSLHTAPVVLRPALERMDGRLALQTPLPEALTQFAEELDDYMSDMVIAALVLNSRLRGEGLAATLTALAESAREELEMRRRVEETRKSIRRAAAIVIAATLVLGGAVTVLTPTFVAPYTTPLGQLMLLVVVGVFAGGLMWMRSAATIEPPARFLADTEQVGRAVLGPSAASGVGGEGR